MFVRYVRGELRALPWSDQPLKPETTKIQDAIESLNAQGYLTINSQPALNGARSSDRIHGWGPKNGYVYQKAYLEFFVSPDKVDALTAKLKKDPYVTYYLVNQRGDMQTNCKDPDIPNAVTWGVFPGKEIVQPTIVEAASFMAWKDEAFQMWHEWAHMYQPASISRDLLTDIANHWYLVNVVHNDYPEAEAIFKPFE
jgi:methylenetetrahydrofolate reductase (NADPH)